MYKIWNVKVRYSEQVHLRSALAKKKKRQKYLDSFQTIRSLSEYFRVRAPSVTVQTGHVTP